MSFLKSVDAARARLRGNATPCDNRDIATPTPETVATSQVSQGGACPETPEPVAVSQMSQEGARAEGVPPVATSQLSQRPPRAPADDLQARLERMVERFYVRAGSALALPWEPTKARADVEAFRDLADEWRHRSPPAPAGDVDQCARCGARARCSAHGAKDGLLWLCAPCREPFETERDRQARAAIIKGLRAAQVRGMLADVDIAALEAAPPRSTVGIAETFDADLRGSGQ
jgi:hypothetical protein